MLKFFISAFFGVTFFFSYSIVYAQNNLYHSDEALDFAKANKTLNDLLKKIPNTSSLFSDNDDVLKTLNSLQSFTLAQQKQDSLLFQSLNQKLEALDELSLGDGKDLPEVIKERNSLNESIEHYKKKLAQAAFILAKIDEANALIFSYRNKELLNNVLSQQNSIFQPQQFFDSFLEFGPFLFKIISSPITWYSSLSVEQKQLVWQHFFSLSFIFIFFLIILLFLKRFIVIRLNIFYDKIAQPSYFQKLKIALGILVNYGILPSFLLFVIKFGITHFPLLDNTLFAFGAQYALIFVIYFFLLRAFFFAVLSPKHPNYSLFINMDETLAKRVFNALVTALMPVIVISFFQKLTTFIPEQINIIYSMQILTNAVKAFAVIWVALKILYNVQKLSDEDVDSGNFQRLSFSSQAALFITLFMLFSFGCSLLGYIVLSEYLINRFIFSAAIIALMYMTKNLLLFLYHWIIRWRFWIAALRIHPKSLVKSEIWFNIILTPIIYCLTVLILLALWGVSVDILIARTKRFLTGFNVGGVYVSISSICLGVLSFWIALILTKLIKNSLISGNLNKLDLDEGMKSSLISGIGFFGFIFSLILGIAVAGGSFQSLAIIAGAISFGAGFGLQNMVSNLAAGLTILFERPIKIGDTVIINGFEGVVSQISMRSTTLETADKSNVIIPNALIISGCVVNKTYDNRMTRVDINLSVGYNCNIEKLKQLLLRIANDDPDVLAFPAPTLSFLDFGESCLNFQLNCYTANIALSAGISFRIREKIINEFRTAGISIPFPQRIIHNISANIPFEQKNI